MFRHTLFSLVVVSVSFGIAASAFASPKRIASLAPHLTEWVYALGAGESIVAVSAYSDYPEKARQHPVIADVNGINLTKLVELKPDLVLVWQSNVKLGQIQKMEKLGLNVFVSDPQKFNDIFEEMVELGELLQQQNVANQYVSDFKQALKAIKNRYKRRMPKSVFFQLWHTPLMTANKHTMINQVLDICGLDNIFADSINSYPTVTKEQVILKQPDYIIISEIKNSEAQAKFWRELTMIPAVKNQNIINLNPDHLHRYSRRVLLGAKELCEKVHE